ncbi:WD40 repeat-like protein [Basidiobolus meristosporus CBS 931.73]|uniref:Protein transport protein SEC31 n=1 Tax=Basidiobolus meristosporus CBS 931.73 TaxID=1314790 RepID=A0A1Y1XYN2_9FUNG|nr:WD40 repeat-like protein [Basidiobolus meristosporus CBS 931.73]|eukprot:ORX90873.1 WD40 repeat-like protein [Basidiobolus meristosporus CBS 931.73]
MKFKEIKRTSTLAWSPHQNQTFIATGTVAGALDASFSSTTELEIFKLDLSDKTPVVDEWKPEVVISSEARFNRLAWGGITEDKPHGILAGGLESGELVLWNAGDLIQGSKDSEKALLLRNSSHSGSVSGLEFNPFQSNLLASGAGNGEIFIWDLSNPTKPYSPGPRSQRLDDITSLSWNNQVQHILATSSTTGYTVVWDLKNRREVMHLAYPGMSNMSAFGGGRRGITAVAWNPDNATQLVTASEDDSNPTIMMWDLRNAHAPEKILSGHTKGILSLSWCKMDSDLLLSSGKDCRTLCWNPRVGEVVGELPQSSNWTFDVQWCPRNPNLLSTASFDGQINIFSLQSASSEAASLNNALEAEQPGDPFAAQSSPTTTAPSFTLKQAPKWFRPPVGATFAFGGKLVMFRNTHASQNPAPQMVTIADAVTEPEVVQRSKELENALESGNIQEFCEKRSQTMNQNEQENWKILRILFESDARDQLVKHLGFEKAELISQVTEKFGKLDFADKVSAESNEVSADKEEASPELKASETTEASAETVPEEDKPEGKESVSELFSTSGGDDNAARNDFFNEQTEQPVDSSSSELTKKKPVVKSPFKINPQENTDVDQLVTRAITLGDFESAVRICLEEDRLSDALILAVCGGTELLTRTQEAYFKRMSKTTPYIRVLQSVITGDLNDVVENADLSEWNEILVILCTYSRAEEFAGLCEKLGQRIEAEWLKLAQDKDSEETLGELRQHAVLCYLAAGNIERVVDIWIAQYKEIEASTIKSLENSEDGEKSGSRYSCHATLLQDFIEKISVFKKAVEKEEPTADAAEADSNDDQKHTLPTQKLAPLYEKYLEYAELMISQGQLSTAVKYINRAPDNEADHGVGLENFYTVLRERLYYSGVDVSGMTAPQFPFEPVFIGGEGEYPQYADTQVAEPQPEPVPAVSTNANVNTVPAATTNAVPGSQVPSVDSGFQSAQQSQQQMYHQNPSYGSQYNYQTQARPSAYQPGYVPQPVQNTMNTSTPYDSYGNSTSYNSGPYGGYQQQQQQPVQQPFVPGYNAPSTYNSGYATQPPQAARGPSPSIPPSQQRNIPAWNDPPMQTLSTPVKRNPTPKVNPITSPFPNAPGASSPNQPPVSPPMGGRTLPPPPMTSHSNAGFPNQTSEPQPQQFASNNQARNPQQPSAMYGAPQYNTAVTPGVPSSGVPGYGSGFNNGMNNAQGRPYQPSMPNAASQMVPNPPSAAQQPAPPASFNPPQKTVSPAPQAPPKPKYPPGDRSKIPAAHKPIFSMLSNELQRIKQSAPPNQKKKVDDVEKRLNNLFDALNYEQLNSDVIDQMLALTQALEMRDFNTAQKIHEGLVKSHTVEPWMVGVKFLIVMVRESCGM